MNIHNAPRTGLIAALFILIGSASSHSQVIPGRYIAVLRDPVQNVPAAAQGLAAQHGLAVGAVYEHALRGFAFAGAPQAAAALARRTEIAYVEPDQIYTAWQQTTPTGIHRADVDETGLIGTGTSVDVDIAIIDTGIGTHSDLNVAGGVRFYVQGPMLRSDGNYNDDNGHGTHVAGTAAARDNGLGVVGVAPGARLWAVKVLDRNGSGTLSGVIQGVDWVTARWATIEVANMSLGGGYSQAINDAVRRGTQAGVVFVVAAGNSNANAVNYSPASEPSAITVSALADSDGQPGGTGAPTGYGPDDTLASFSNWGPSVDICAPGVGILSTLPGNAYGTYSGTSMASPHVAGAAALYMALAPDRPSVAEVEAALLSSGWTQADAGYYFTGDRDSQSEPLLNVGALVDVVPTDPPPSDLPVHCSDLDGSVSTAGANWRATVEVTVLDSSSNPVSGATVLANWGGGASGSAQGTTGPDGKVSILSGTIPKRFASATFTLADITGEGLIYSPSANSDGDVPIDSNGTTITVFKP